MFSCCNVSVEEQNKERTTKIERYKEQKSINARLIELQRYIDQDHVDEELKVFIE